MPTPMGPPTRACDAAVPRAITTWASNGSTVRSQCLHNPLRVPAPDVRRPVAENDPRPVGELQLETPPRQEPGTVPRRGDDLPGRRPLDSHSSAGSVVHHQQSPIGDRDEGVRAPRHRLLHIPRSRATGALTGAPTEDFLDIDIDRRSRTE